MAYYLSEMEDALEVLKYPIGRFDWSIQPSFDDRIDAIRGIAALPFKMRNAVHGLNDKQLDTPYRPDGWTVRQVVHHVADSHVNAYIRFKIALTEDKPVIRPYAQALWAKLSDSKLPPALSLNLLEGIHERWSVILESMSEEDWEKGYTHPEHNTWQVLDKVVTMYRWHGEHHLAHITGLMEREGWV